jgi:hypothetical protein
MGGRRKGERINVLARGPHAGMKKEKENPKRMKGYLRTDIE